MTLKSEINVYVTDPTQKQVQVTIWELLRVIDQEFVPPLSSRESTTDMVLAGDSSNSDMNNLLSNYFQGILQQDILLACLNNEYVGLMTFKHNYSKHSIDKYCPCNYITTLGVFPEYRNCGVAHALYHFILNELPNDLICKYTVTRTWASNYGHIHLLQKLGFCLVETLKDHRGIGIDTVYYAYSEKTCSEVNPSIRTEGRRL